ncbi:MAG: hypothetical protein ACE10K_05810, partial [Rhodothermales bacterium]
VFAYEASFAGLDPPGGAKGSHTIRGRKKSYQTSINGGGARLSLATHSGSLRLSNLGNGN